MFKTCHHVMPNGLRCQSPAMRGYAFCYYHGRRAPRHKDRPSETHIELPDPLDRTGIADALRQILRALRSNRLSPRRASILLYTGCKWLRLIGTAPPSHLLASTPILPGCPPRSAPCSPR
jgi:hypothetical protein